MGSVLALLGSGWIAGIIANRLVRGGSNGRVGNVVIGLLGAGLGVGVALLLGLRPGAWALGGIMPAVAGASFLLAVVHGALPRDDRYMPAAAKDDGPVATAAADPTKVELVSCGEQAPPHSSPAQAISASVGQVIPGRSVHASPASGNRRGDDQTFCEDGRRVGRRLREHSELSA